MGAVRAFISNSHKTQHYEVCGEIAHGVYAVGHKGLTVTI